MSDDNENKAIVPERGNERVQMKRELRGKERERQIKRERERREGERYREKLSQREFLRK